MKLIVFLFLLVFGCGSSGSKKPPLASEVDHPIHETDLPLVRLTPQAITRLGIQTAIVENSTLPHTRLVGGEVVVPPGRTAVVNAPVAGMVHIVAEGLIPGMTVRRGASLLRLTAMAPADRDTRARVNREVAAAEANLAALEQRVKRNQALVDERAGSVRALEEAVAARDIAKADVETARVRASTLSRDPLLSDVALNVRAPGDGVVRVLSIAEGQTVASGAPLLEIVGVDALQVRVPVYGGDLGRLDTRAVARVRRSGKTQSVEARFSAGPPTAEPDRGTVDRYLTLPADAGFSPGQRVLVELPLQDLAAALNVPASAIVFDAWGGAWVYRCEANRYVRVRVDPVRRIGERMMLAHGPPAGACVVSVGAAEIFGAEFPTGH